jgi:CRISPR/Cas system CMR-associated protein Cmr5 small subunit
MKIYAVQNMSIFDSYNEKYFTTRQKAREYLKECYKSDKEHLKGDIPKLEDLQKGEKRYELLKDRYYVKYWEKNSYEYNEWGITACGKRIIEIEVEE